MRQEQIRKTVCLGSREKSVVFLSINVTVHGGVVKGQASDMFSACAISDLSHLRSTPGPRLAFFIGQGMRIVKAPHLFAQLLANTLLLANTPTKSPTRLLIA